MGEGLHSNCEFRSLYVDGIYLELKINLCFFFSYFLIINLYKN